MFGGRIHSSHLIRRFSDPKPRSSAPIFCWLIKSAVACRRQPNLETNFSVRMTKYQPFNFSSTNQHIVQGSANLPFQFLCTKARLCARQNLYIRMCLDEFKRSVILTQIPDLSSRLCRPEYPNHNKQANRLIGNWTVQKPLFVRLNHLMGFKLKLMCVKNMRSIQILGNKFSSCFYMFP